MEFELNERNFLLYAMHNYENPQCVNIEEFHEDIQRLKYLKRLFKRFEEKSEIKERLILNHLVVLGNVYKPEILRKILFFKIDREHWPMLKTFLCFLNLMSVEDNENIPLHVETIKTLRSI
jgi:hypothetical protein